MIALVCVLVVSLGLMWGSSPQRPWLVPLDDADAEAHWLIDPVVPGSLGWLKNSFPKKFWDALRAIAGQTLVDKVGTVWRLGSFTMARAIEHTSVAF
jgi:hypothetical protein